MRIFGIIIIRATKENIPLNLLIAKSRSISNKSSKLSRALEIKFPAPAITDNIYMLKSEIAIMIIGERTKLLSSFVKHIG